MRFRASRGDIENCRALGPRCLHGVKQGFLYKELIAWFVYPPLLSDFGATELDNDIHYDGRRIFEECVYGFGV